MSAETGHFRAEGGTVFEMDLPLSEVMAYKLARRELVRVNADGTDYTPPADEDEPVPGGPPKPAAAKPEWVGYAVTQGMSLDDADAMTKNDLIERFGKK